MSLLLGTIIVIFILVAWAKKRNMSFLGGNLDEVDLVRDEENLVNVREGAAQNKMIVIVRLLHDEKCFFIMSVIYLTL